MLFTREYWIGVLCGGIVTFLLLGVRILPHMEFMEHITKPVIIDIYTANTTANETDNQSFLPKGYNGIRWEDFD